MFPLMVYAQGGPTGPSFECNNCTPSQVCILEPNHGIAWICIEAEKDELLIFKYLNGGILDTIYTSAYGITVLWLIIGGILYMVGKVDQGKQNMMWAILGLLMLFFSGLILSTINGFYTSGSLEDGIKYEKSHIMEYIIPTAHAQRPPVCEYIEGVKAGDNTINCATENLFLDFLTPIISFLLILAGGIVVAMIVYGGAQLLLGFGSDGMIQQGKTTILMAILGFVMVLTSQTILTIILEGVSANGAGTSGASTVEGLAVSINEVLDFIIGVVSGVLTSLFVIVIIVAGFQLLFAEGKDDKFNRARTAIVWGIIGVIIINLAQVIARAILSLGL
jgi:hypothetical protein